MKTKFTYNRMGNKGDLSPFTRVSIKAQDEISKIKIINDGKIAHLVYPKNTEL